jgi:hypothetical protein
LLRNILAALQELALQKKSKMTEKEKVQARSETGPRRSPEQKGLLAPSQAIEAKSVLIQWDM